MEKKRSRKRLYWLIALAVVVILALVAMVATKKRDKPSLVTTD